MIDLPTPETDAVAEKNIYGVACKVDVDFARKLERQRDELQDALEHAQMTIGSIVSPSDKATLELIKVTKERDEARAEWGKTSMDAAQLLSEKTKVIAERDEARESLENARELNKWLTVFLEHIRDNADIRYGKHLGLLAFSDLREEASRKWKEAAK